MTTPGRLTVGADGRLTGRADITWNSPWPTNSGSWGSGAMNGVVMHTEVGYEHSVIDEFNNITAQASAHFSIGIDGHVHQYGPIGQGWIAWAQMGGNEAWYSIEHEDQGHPETPLTPAQVTASAQVVECLSAYAGFPLQEANSPSERGYGVHYMGGQAWGGHTCPDTGPSHPVRSLQRPAILALAKEIRTGNPAPSLPYRHLAAEGQTLGQIASARGTTAAHLLSLSAKEYTAADEAALSALKLPAGTPFYTSNPG